MLETSAIKLLYMGANRFGRVWKKAVSDQPSFYGPNFNYKPMLPDSSVRSIDDVETACTLVQIGDNVAPYMLDSEILETPLFEGPKVTMDDDAMDKIVGKLDVCMWKPSNSVDAMDQIISESESVCVNVETKSTDELDVVLNVETKRCTVRLVRLDSILFGDSSDNSAGVTEDDNANSQKTLETPPSLSRLHPQNRSSRATRRPRKASQNKQYTEEPEPPPPVKTQSGYVKNIKPSASGPSEESINAQRNLNNPF